MLKSYQLCGFACFAFVPAVLSAEVKIEDSRYVPVVESKATMSDSARLALLLEVDFFVPHKGRMAYQLALLHQYKWKQGHSLHMQPTGYYPDSSYHATKMRLLI